MSLRRPTITAKKLVGTFFLLCIGIILAGMLFYFQLSDRIKYKTHQELKAVSNLKVEQIRKWKSERLAEGIFMQENKTFSRLAERYFSQRRDSSSLKEMVDWLNIIRLNHLYEIIDIIDKDGHIVYRLGDNDYKWKSFMLSYFSDKKKDAGISFSKLHRDSHGHAHIDMIIPIFTSPENKTGSIIAYISFRLNPEADLFPIIQNWPTNSYSSESILLLRDGDSVVFINSLRHFKNSPLNFRMPVNKPNLPAAAAARGYQGFMEGIDYRGREVMAYIQKVNGSDWYMVAKTDSDEVLSGLRTGGILTLMLVLVLMITSGLSLVTVWNRHRLESMRKLVEAEAQQKVLLKHFEYLTLHANDIILLTNESGNIIEANARAEKAYEYSRSQLIGKNISSVFSNDTMRLLQLSNSDQGLVYEGQNIKHDGSMFPVEISSRSMVYENNVFVQHIIRDITERKLSEKRIYHLNHVLKSIRNVNQLITSERNKERLIRDACNKLVENSSYYSSWIILQDTNNNITMTACSGSDEEFKNMVESLRSSKIPNCMRETTHSGRPVIINDFAGTCKSCSLAQKHEKRYGVVTRLEFEGRTYGFFMVSLPDGYVVDEEEYGLFVEVAGDLSFALYSIELDEQKELAVGLLKDNREKLETIIDNLPALIAYVDSDERYVFVNSMYTTVFRMNKEEIIGRTVRELIGERQYQLCKPFMDKVFNGEATVYETTITTPERDMIIMQNLIPHINEDGKIKAYFSLVQDITAEKAARDEIKEGKRKLETLMNNLPGLAYQCMNDAFFTMEFVSMGCYELTGYHPEQLVNNNEISYLEIIHPDDRQMVADAVNLALRKREFFRINYRIITAYGELRWVWEQGCGIFSENDELLSIEGFITDITPQMNVQKALRESEQKFREMADLLPQTVFEIDLNGKFTYVNKHGYELSGYSPEEIGNGFNALDIFIPQEKQLILNNIQRVANGEQVLQAEYTAINKDGDTFPVITYSAPIRHEDKIVGIRGFAIDITELKKAEAMLKESEQKYRELADLLPQPIFETDMNGKFTFVNQFGMDTFGYKKEDVINLRYCYDMIIPEDRPIGIRNIQRILKGEVAATGNEYMAIRKDGNLFPIVIYSSPIIRNGIIVGLRGAILDITEIRKATEEIKELNKELENRVKDRTSQLEDALEELRLEIDERQKTEEMLRKAKEELSNALANEKELNELKTRFISMVSHEYRTPLTVILSSTELLDVFYRKQNKVEFEKSLNRIKTSIRLMVELLENVLAMGKAESGSGSVIQTRFDIIEFASDIIEEIKMIDNQDHKIIFSNDVTNRLISSDKKVLRQILNNLLSNACKYTPDNKDVIIDINETETEYEFRVIDQGIGISAEDQKHLFDPFFRGKNTGKISGTGLGLSIVKKSVEQLGGVLTVLSELNAGTTFILKLRK